MDKRVADVANLLNEKGLCGSGNNRVTLAEEIVALFPEPSVEGVEKQVAHRTEIIQSLLKDACDDDTEIRKLAKKVLTEYQVEGDSYGVPTIVGVVELVVNIALSKFQIKGEGGYCSCEEKPVRLISHCRNCGKEIENPPTIKEMLEEPHPENGGVCCCGGIELKEGTKVIGDVVHCKTKPCYITDKPLPPQETENEKSFTEQLRSLINCNSVENASNTPDFILAQFMNECLWAGEKLVREREKWYGKEHNPCL